MNRDLGISLPTPVVSEPPVYAEKRRKPRRQLSVRCWLTDGTHTIYARVHDVSMGGLSICTPVPFARGAQLEMALTLRAGELVDVRRASAIRARGRVVWVHAREGGPRMGAEFLDVHGEATLRRILGA